MTQGKVESHIKNIKKQKNMNSHEIDYKIYGEEMHYVEVDLYKRVVFIGGVKSEKISIFPVF